MELTQPNEEIQNIKVDSLIWSQPQLQSSQSISPFRVYTANSNIKNAYMLSHIKPDYGSLGEFMKDVGITKDILLHNRKKKLDQQQDLEQKKMRTTLRGKNLERIIRQDGNNLEKVIASKMIVENLFQKNFGNTISNFCIQNNKQQNNKASYSSVNSFAEILDNLIIRHKYEHTSQRQSKQELPVLSRNKNHLSSKLISMVGEREKMDKIRQIKAFYPSLRKYQLENIEGQGESQTIQTTLFQHTFLITKQHTTFPSLLKYIKQIRIEDVRKIKMVTSLSDQLICFILDFFSQIRNANIFQLHIEQTRFGNNQKMSTKIKEFIQKTSLNKLTLNSMGLRSKDFCVICLGIGSKASFQSVIFRDNEIGELAIKCLNVLMKFHKNTLFDFSGNPLEKELKGNKFYKRCLPSRGTQ